jgi:hypothetical protein
MSYARHTWRGARLKLMAVAALPVLVVAITGLAAAPAQGSATAAVHSRSMDTATEDEFQFCAQGGAGYCLNDWNGTIGDVKMYNSGVVNNSFAVEPLTLCPNDSVGDSPGNYCPFANHALDQHFAGDEIFQLESGVNPDWCLGTSATSSLTILQPCNTANGTGGGDGTIFLEGTVTCINGGGYYWGNRYWSQHYNTPEYLESGGAIGKQANADYSGGSISCWLVGPVLD